MEGRYRDPSTIAIIVEDQIIFNPGNFKWSLSLWYTQGSEKKNDKANSKKSMSWIQYTCKLKISARLHHK